MLTEDDIQQQYPLHNFVWKNLHNQLKDYLSSHSKVRIENIIVSNSNFIKSLYSGC